MVAATAGIRHLEGLIVVAPRRGHGDCGKARWTGALDSGTRVDLARLPTLEIQDNTRQTARNVFTMNNDLLKPVHSNDYTLHSSD